MSENILETLRGSGISPAQLLGALDYPVRASGNGGFSAECPSCGSQLILTPHGGWCRNRACRTKTLTTIDLAALLRGSYEKGLDALRDLAPDWVVNFRTEGWQVTREQLARAARQQRSLLDYLHAQHSAPRTGERLEVVQALKRLGADIDILGSHVSALPKKQQAEFLNIVERLTGTRPVLPDVDCGVFYFFSDPHTVANLAVVPLRQKIIKITRIRILPRKFSYCGILNQPSGSSAIMRQNFIEAAKACSDTMGTSGLQWQIGFIYEAGAQLDYVPDFEGIFFDTQRDIHITPLHALRLERRDVPITMIRKDGSRQVGSWDDLVIDFLCVNLDAEGLSDRIRLLIETCDLSSVVRGRVFQHLRLQGKFDLMDVLSRLFRSRLVHDEEKISLHEYHEGYYTKRKDKTGSRFDLTNFTVTLTNNLAFQESADLYHSGTCSCGSKVFPVSLSPSDLQDPIALETNCRVAMIKSGGDCNTLPLVRDKLQAKPLLRYLRERAAGLPHQLGVLNLGWAFDKPRFVGPGWMQNADGHGEKQVILHPAMLPSELQGGPIFKKTKPELRQLSLGHCRAIGRLLASVVRGYLGRPLRPVVYDEQSETRRQLESIFRGFGQQQIYTPPVGARSLAFLEHTRTCPILITGPVAKHLVNLNRPVFALTEKPDRQLGELADPDKLQDLVSWMTTRVLDWIFSGAAEQMPLGRSVLFEEQLDVEAAFFCREALGLTGWPKHSGSFAALHALLAGRCFEQFSAELEYEPHTQRLTWTPRPKADVTDALIELRAHLGIAWETADGGISANAVELEPLFENYFGQKLQPNIRYA